LLIIRKSTVTAIPQFGEPVISTDDTILASSSSIEDDENLALKISLPIVFFLVIFTIAVVVHQYYQRQRENKRAPPEAEMNNETVVNPVVNSFHGTSF